MLDRLAACGESGTRAALATVVRVRGSAYRHEGAKMLVTERGEGLGNVSGGCLEADVREVAMRVLATGRPETREYCGSADEIAAWDLGVGCEGVVEVYVAPAAHDSGEWLARARDAIAAQAPFAVATDLESGAPTTITGTDASGPAGADVVRVARSLLVAGESSLEVVNGRETFFDVLRPPPRLLILSAGDDARPLAALAASVGFHVIVADRRPALLTAERFPGAELVAASGADAVAVVQFDRELYAVAMAHNYADDRSALRAMLSAPVQYIGMLGPRQRTERMLRELAATDPGIEHDERIHGPVGLDIGADGAEQVALAIVAEILAVRSGRRPASLRERRAPIHADLAG